MEMHLNIKVKVDAPGIIKALSGLIFTVALICYLFL
jgi:hypothetical protein